MYVNKFNKLQNKKNYYIEKQINNDLTAIKLQQNTTAVVVDDELLKE